MILVCHFIGKNTRYVLVATIVAWRERKKLTLFLLFYLRYVVCLPDRLLVMFSFAS